MLPLNKDCLYSSQKSPAHLANYVEQFDFDYQNDYYGGVCIFNKTDFQEINGFSNEYWGWGGEDNDLNLRVLFKGIAWHKLPGIYKSQKHKRILWDSSKKISLHKHFGLNKSRLNSMKKGRVDFTKDGLSNLDFSILSEKKLSEKVTNIVVKI
jgi:GT2 family glycosyltransferase